MKNVVYSKKSCPTLIVHSLYKNGQDFLDIEYREIPTLMPCTIMKPSLIWAITVETIYNKTKLYQ